MVWKTAGIELDDGSNDGKIKLFVTPVPVTNTAPDPARVRERLSNGGGTRDRILFRCWQTRTPYDEQIYLNSLKQKQSPLLAVIEALPPRSAGRKAAAQLAEAAL